MKTGHWITAAIVAGMMTACGQKETKTGNNIDIEGAIELASETPLNVSDYFTKVQP